MFYLARLGDPQNTKTKRYEVIVGSLLNMFWICEVLF
jgi:hypothetical protein